MRINTNIKIHYQQPHSFPMSSHQYRVKISDQENAFKLQQKNENQQLPAKRAALQPKVNKKQRVPLGGKDPNGAIPSLQRSSTTVQKPQKLLSHVNLVKQPLLQKSNSSLGFSHFNTTPASIPSRHNGLTPSQIKNADPLKNDLFSGTSARREAELVPQLVSDSPRKRERPPLPPLGTKLSDTFSEATSRLHASNLPAEPLNPDVDPVKGLKLNTSLLEQLADDEESVETVPQIIPLKDEPEDPLTEDDLHFLRTGKRVSVVQNKKLQAELEQQHGHLGLSKKELDELLEF